MNRRGGQDGYVLFGIAIGLIILGIAMGMAVPLWQKVVQREREKELIFRGYQYMQAIELYQRKFPGAFPPSVEVLVEGKFLRREYEDPMSEDGKWRILRQMSPELQPGGLGGAQGPGSPQRGGINNLNRSRGQLRQPGQTQGGAGGFTRSPTGGGFQSSLGRSATDAGQGLGGIVGVASTSDEETFYEVPGKEKYKDWLFVYGVQQMAPAQTVRPGQAGGAGQSPFPGLPPPPGLTSFRFGSTPAAAPGQQPQQPGRLPGAPTQPGGVGQPGLQGPGGRPGAGQSGFPGQPGLSQGNRGRPGFGTNPQQQDPRRRTRPPQDE